MSITNAEAYRYQFVLRTISILMECSRMDGSLFLGCPCNRFFFFGVALERLGRTADFPLLYSFSLSYSVPYYVYIIAPITQKDQPDAIFLKKITKIIVILRVHLLFLVLWVSPYSDISTKKA